jgi:hypothetical protein
MARMSLSSVIFPGHDVLSMCRRFDALSYADAVAPASATLLIVTPVRLITRQSARP